MTVELQNVLESDIQSALEAKDEARYWRVMSRAMLALIDCQRKTAERVKKLCDERAETRAKVKGAALLWNALKLIAATGGGALVLRLVNAG